jgi:hypothetical protein
MSLLSRVLVLFALTAAAHIASAAEPLRKWTNPQGKSIQARLISIEGATARLQMAHGDFVNVSLEKFSEEDRKYLESRKAAAGAGDSTTLHNAAAKSDGKAAKSPNAATAESELKRNRKWTDRRGKQVNARFVRFHDGKAILMQGNKPVDVPFGDLSDADQAFLKERYEALGKGDDVPPAIATPTPGVNGNPGAVTPPWLARQQGPPGAMPENIGGIPTRLSTPPRIELPRPFLPPANSPSPPAAADNAAQSSAQNAVGMNTPTGSAQASTSVASAPAFDPSASQSQQPLYQRQTSNLPDTSHRPSSAPKSSDSSPFFKWGQESADTSNISAPQIASAPPMSSPFSAARNENEMVIQCGKCGKTQKPGFKAGSSCQHCGTVIDVIVDEGGKTVDRSVRATGKMIKMWVAIAILVLGLIGGAIAKLRGS